jgi:hypothetical protein
MRLNRPSTFPFMLAALTVWTIPARADPIIAVFDVTVVARTSVITFTEEPFERSFPLLMSFDPPAHPKYPYDPYGPVRFSTVPLGQSPPSGIELTTVSLSLHGSIIEEEFEADQLAEARQLQTAFIPDGVFSGVFSSEVRLLSWIDNVSPLPAFTPQTFPVHLSARGEVETNFSYEAALFQNGQFSRDSYSYVGRATFREFQAPVVPEPATVALVGGGLALLAAKRHRRGKQSRS